MKLCYACVFYRVQVSRAALGIQCGKGRCESCQEKGYLYNAIELVNCGEPSLRRRERIKEPASGTTFGVLVLGFAIAIAVATLLIAKCSEGAPLSLEDYAQQAIRRLPTFYEDNPPGGVAGRTAQKEAQLTLIASEVAKAARRRPPLPPRRWAALLLTIGYHESTFSLRIHAGDCRPHECDHGKARGVFQGHLNLANKPVWDQMQGLDNTAVQVAEADRLLRRVVMTCTPPGKSPDGYVRGIFEAYGGRRCGGDWEGADKRLETFRRLQ